MHNDTFRIKGKKVLVHDDTKYFFFSFQLKFVKFDALFIVISFFMVKCDHLCKEVRWGVQSDFLRHYPIPLAEVSPKQYIFLCITWKLIGL